MKIKIMILLVGILFAPFWGPHFLHAADVNNCTLFSEKELISIKDSKNSSLIMGTAITAFVIDPASPVGKELLNIASTVESPKGMATVSLIIYQIANGLPLKPVRENIFQLLKADKDNALSHYLNAFLMEEEGKKYEALAQIRAGNEKPFNSYPKQRFYAIVEAGEMAKCTRIQAQRFALWNALSTPLFIKARHTCQNLIETTGPEARSICFFMGQNLENSAITIIDKLNSISIQKTALHSSSSNSEVMADINSRRDKALNCDGKTTNWRWIPESEVAQDVDLKYDEIYLEKGECSALEYLNRITSPKAQ